MGVHGIHLRLASRPPLSADYDTVHANKPRQGCEEGGGIEIPRMFFHVFRVPGQFDLRFLSVFDPAARSRTTLFSSPSPSPSPCSSGVLGLRTWFIISSLSDHRSQITDSGLGLCLACLVGTVHPYRFVASFEFDGVGPIGKARWVKARMRYQHLTQSDLAQQSRLGSSSAQTGQLQRPRHPTLTSHLDDFRHLQTIDIAIFS